MLKSVWITNVILTSLNDASSPLACYYKHLNCIVNSSQCIMCLNEPDNSETTYFLINDKSACIIPSPSAELNNDALNKAMKTKQSVCADGKTYCPLYFENVASFGVLVFDAEAEHSNKLSSALVAFSALLYSESMGSIVKSYHNCVMKAENVCVDYRNGKLVNRVVKNVNFEVYEKEFTMIVGASGCGKSSLLNVLGGMLTPSDGNVWWKDTAVSAMNDKQRTAYRGNTVGFIFQRYNLISDLTAEENVKIASSLVKNPLSSDEVLDMVGLKHKAKNYPSQLSGGEQQRVCIARALVKRAELLLCDEPTGALDTVNAMQIIKILQNIAKEQGIPVVVITHNPSLVVLADHCLTMSNGEIVEDKLQPFALSAEDLVLR